MGKNKWQSLKDVVLMSGTNKVEMTKFVEEYNGNEPKFVGEIRKGIQGSVPSCFATHRIKNLYLKEKVSGIQICGEVELYNKAYKHSKLFGEYSVAFYPLYAAGGAEMCGFGIRLIKGLGLLKVV